jgi:replication factor C subunit 2/4
MRRLTQDAQGALRRVMEIYSTTTRFALCCNYVSRIIDPIASRCSKFRFKTIEGRQAKARIAEILNLENISYENGVIEHTLKASDGDLRRTLNLLQSAARLAGASAPVPNERSNGKKNVIPDDSDEEMEDANPKSAAASNKMIRISDIDAIAGTFPPSLTNNLIKVLQKGNTRNYNNIANEITDVVASGYAANEVLFALYAKIIIEDEGDIVVGKNGDVSEGLRKKSALANVFSEFDKRLIDGVDENLALLAMSCEIAGILAA